jgi:hypothetical protein
MPLPILRVAVWPLRLTLMSVLRPAPDWQELERITVSTAHVREVTDLLLVYAAGRMTPVDLASLVRELCQEAQPGTGTRSTGR